MTTSLVHRGASCAIITVALLTAQTGAPPSPPSPAQRVADQVARLTAALGLNSAQQAQATTIYTDLQTAMASVMASMKTAHDALNAAVLSNDAATITAQAAQIGSLTAQQTESRAKADAAFYAILTADQQTRYKQLPHGGPGGGPNRPPLPPPGQ